MKSTHHYSGIHESNEVEAKGDDEGEVNSQVVHKSSIGKHVGEVDSVWGDKETWSKGGEVVAGTDCDGGVGIPDLWDGGTLRGRF